MLNRRLRGLLGAVFLAMCLMLGGASARGAGAAANALLQISAMVLIVMLLWRRRAGAAPLQARQLALIVLVYAAWVLISMVPLPVSVWSALPGRDAILNGYQLLDLSAPSLPVSLSWQHSLSSLLWLLPPVAVFLLVLQSPPAERKRLLWVVIGLTAASIVLGVAQLLGGEGSALRFYQITNRSQPVGFFSNANHFAIMLVCGLPIAGYLAGRGASRRASRAERSSAVIVAGAVATFLLAGIGTTGSLAGYGLALPAALAAVLIYRKAAFGRVGLVWGGALGAMFVLFLGIALVGPLNNQVISAKFSGAPASRSYIAERTIDAAIEYFPVGSGLGTFQEVYRPFDDPNRASNEYTNHAHNDYLEVALELGLPGILLILAFLAWWLRQWLTVWRSDFEGAGLGRAGSVMILVVLLHSVVDYPLRTSAVAALFALACALLVPYVPPLRPKSSEEDAEALRHLKAE